MSNLSESIKESGFKYTDEYIFDRLVKLEEEVNQLKKQVIASPDVETQD